MLFTAIRKSFPLFEKLDHLIYPPPSPPHPEYLHGLKSFCLPNGDKYELNGVDYKEVKDLALFKFLTSGFKDQDGKVGFFLTSIGIIGNPFRKTIQSFDDISTYLPYPMCKYPNCIVFFITYDKNRGRKRGLKSISVDEISKICFALIVAKGKNRSQEERMVLVGEQIGKQMAQMVISPTIPKGLFINMNGQNIDMGDPPWVTFGFNRA